MAGDVLHVLKEALMITGFVFMMMLVIEYVNVLTRGTWQEKIAGHKWVQYVLAAFLGATPGCLGAFAVVAMYSHRTVTAGAVVAAMVATSGDAAFVMFATVPRAAVLITGILFVLGIPAGMLTDRVFGRRMAGMMEFDHGFDVHAEHLDVFPHGEFLRQWKECSAARGILVAVLTIFLLAVVFGQVGPEVWDWKRITGTLLTALALLIVVSVPDHFLDEHLWRHVARRHALKLFFWTLGALVVMHVLTDYLHLEETIQQAQWLRWVILTVACLVGLIPDSGPHIVFVTLFAQGAAPFSVLLANSIVQDGHGMLPLLAHSRRAFLGIKAINLVVGILIGAIVMLFGY
ncbi:MAG: hypothetical protein AMK75_02940 [Planctomycetes bacterium SM23_65]|nr:MAG: hypothetical protein AMK75_02940 [Planctomycetes bacterium SM23_65]